jgi:probable F420-dependent oxidoreductase
VRPDLGSIGVWGTARDATPEVAAEVEALGYGTFWIGGSPRGDLGVVERLLDATERLTVATGIVNMWREPASEVAASYHRIEERHPGRFVLGVGIGHPEVTSEYQTPLEKIDDYLTRLEESGVPKDRIVLAALGPKVLRIAGDRTAGAHPYLTTPSHTAFAREVLGDGPLLAPEHKVIVGLDPDAARAVGRPVVSRYLTRVTYRNNLRREGWPDEDLADGGSDALVDALVLHGSPKEVAAGIRLHLAAGADHVAIQPLGDDAVSECRALAPLLIG